MCQGGWRSATDDRRSLVDEAIVLEGLYHEQGKIDTTGEVALEDGIAHVTTPHGQALAFPFFEVATANNGPQGVAGEHAATSLHLIVDIHEASEATEPAGDDLVPLETRRVHIQAVAGDMPPAREYEARARTGIVEDRLSCSGGILVDPPRDQHGEDPIAIRDCTANHCAVVCGSWNDGKAAGERVELPDTALATHANYIVASI